MPSADPALAHVRPTSTVGAHRRRGDLDRVRTTQRWAASVLTLATVVLLAYVAMLVVAAWLFVFAWDVVAGRQSGPLETLALARDIAPALLVGWCTGLATSAVLARGEALGARTAGLVSGVVGSVAGAALLALTDLL